MGSTSLGQFWKPLGNTKSWLGNITATSLLVAAWGYFLYHGAVDPAGIAKSLWPIFGISNQLLAVIAFSLGTTILIKSGKLKYAWVTFVPQMFLTAVTFYAGYLKIFSPRAAGFLPEIAKLEAALPGASDKVARQAMETAPVNARVDVAVVSAFLVLVGFITIGCAVEWWRVLSGRKAPGVNEADYVALPAENA